MVSSREHKCGKYRVNLPTKYGTPKGLRKICRVAKLSEVMKSLEWQSASKVGCPEGYLGTYIVCLKDGCVMLSGISSFVGVERSFTKIEEVEVSNTDKRAFVSSLDYTEVDKFALLE